MPLKFRPIVFIEQINRCINWSYVVVRYWTYWIANSISFRTPPPYQQASILVPHPNENLQCLWSTSGVSKLHKEPFHMTSAKTGGGHVSGVSKLHKELFHMTSAKTGGGHVSEVSKLHKELFHMTSAKTGGGHVSGVSKLHKEPFHMTSAKTGGGKTSILLCNQQARSLVELIV